VLIWLDVFSDSLIALSLATSLFAKASADDRYLFVDSSGSNYTWENDTRQTGSTIQMLIMQVIDTENNWTNSTLQ